MSLGINATTTDGMVLAADSRQSYRNQNGMARIGSDSASKIFKLTDRVGIIIAGLAFLEEDGVFKNISNFIDDFINSKDLTGKTVTNIANLIKAFFEEKYNFKSQLASLPQNIEADLVAKGCTEISIKVKNYFVEFTCKSPDGIVRNGIAGVDQLQFILAGYNPDNTYSVYSINIPGDKPIELRDSKDKNKQYGASWIGQTDVITRIVLGYDGRIGNVPFVQKASSKIGQQEVQQQLGGLEYAIQWGTMTLQDAIDFCKLSIETTTAIQRFSDGILANPGDIPGVGGPVDMAIITPKKGFIWINKKNLTLDDNKISLDSFKDLGNTLDKNEKPKK